MTDIEAAADRCRNRRPPDLAGGCGLSVMITGATVVGDVPETKEHNHDFHWYCPRR